MAKNKSLPKQVSKEIANQAESGLTGRMAGPKPPKVMTPGEAKRVGNQGLGYMSPSDPDDSLMEFLPSKRELAMRDGKKKDPVDQ